MTLTTRPWRPEQVAALREHLDLLTAAGTVPGGVIACGTARAEPTFVASGIVAPECGDTRPGPDTRYDLASLTKVVATWALAGQARADRRITLSAPIRSLLPEVPDDAPGGGVTVGQILTHTSGLRPETRLDLYHGRSEPLAQLICSEPLTGTPGKAHQYINRGFILLGLALAQLHHRPLETLAAELWTALGMTGTAYGPLTRTTTVAPTVQRLSGAPRLHGTVHDDAAALLGGVAGHAGVFGTAADLATFADRLLDADGELGNWLGFSARPRARIEPGLGRGLAWIVTDDGNALYHHGFTGTSLYLAPATGRYLALCTNAVYHRPDNRAALAQLRALALKEITN
ncbi:CubicO group peptidase (beta-lactamase class C family) [Kitasatospora gansuensis]|uniref:CubicO group peptidase (Beta-lactamase class C family) n=1 Tax=Kitasatospora gansuensis TaxID=258050 RepID=A0A7W7SG74_9ACTN|nr:serine hydrolase domain-containing protein [Kitasatospora gansuensis]MBB4949507.1 CubicO group peptidase (beta-lactamase class C family) [Kitasatospora gansuensis]